MSPAHQDQGASFGRLGKCRQFTKRGEVVLVPRHRHEWLLRLHQQRLVLVTFLHRGEGGEGGSGIGGLLPWSPSPEGNASLPETPKPVPSPIKKCQQLLLQTALIFGSGDMKASTRRLPSTLGTGLHEAGGLFLLIPFLHPGRGARTHGSGKHLFVCLLRLVPPLLGFFVGSSGEVSGTYSGNPARRGPPLTHLARPGASKGGCPICPCKRVTSHTVCCRHVGGGLPKESMYLRS